MGSLDPPTLSAGEPGSVYNEVGYAGMVWHNYDLGCAGTAFNPASTTDTWLGNQAFNVAKFGVGGVNWAHYLISGGGNLLAPLDGVIRDATSAMYQAVFTTWIGPALVVLSVILLVLAIRGDLARQAQRTAFALAALMVGSAAYLTPVEWAKAADGLLLDGVTQMQEGFLSQVGLGDRDTLPTVLVDRVVYDNWLRGEFGSPDVPQAQQLGRNLLRAQTFTKQEVAEGRDNATLAEQKKTDFGALAGQMGDRYTYFQGKSGSRIGVGILAVIQAACIALFQLLSKVLVLTALLLLRLMVMTAPAIAVVAVLKPEILPALLRVAGRGDRQHDRRRCAGGPARAAGRHALPARLGHRPVARAAGHRGGDGGAVGGGAAVPPAGLDGVADERAVRRDRARGGHRPDVPGVAPGARWRGRRPAVPVVGGAAFRGRGRHGLRLRAARVGAGGGAGVPGRSRTADAAPPDRGRRARAAEHPGCPPSGAARRAERSRRRLGDTALGGSGGDRRSGDLPQAGCRAAAPGSRAPGDPRAGRRRAGLPDLPARPRPPRVQR